MKREREKSRGERKEKKELVDAFPSRYASFGGKQTKIYKHLFQMFHERRENIQELNRIYN